MATSDPLPRSAALTRRQALLGSTAALVIGASAPPRAFAAQPAAMRLLVGRRTLEVNGKTAPVYSLAPAAGQRVDRFRLGQNFTVTLENQLAEPSWCIGTA